MDKGEYYYQKQKAGWGNFLAKGPQKTLLQIREKFRRKRQKFASKRLYQVKRGTIFNEINGIFVSTPNSRGLIAGESILRNLHCLPNRLVLAHMFERWQKLLRWKRLCTTKVFAGKNVHRIFETRTIEITLLLLFIKLQLHIKWQLFADYLDSFNPSFSASYTRSDNQPPEPLRLTSRESSGKSATPTVAQNMEAGPVAKVKAIKKIVQLGNEKAFLPQRFVASCLR